MYQIHTAGNGNTIVVVQIPVVSGGVGRSARECADQRTINGVDGNRGVARHIDEADLCLQLACCLISRITVIGVRYNVYGIHNRILVTLASVVSGCDIGKCHDVGGKLEHIHRIVSVDRSEAGIFGSCTIVAQELAIAVVNIEFDGNSARNVLRVVDALVHDRHIDPRNS